MADPSRAASHFTCSCSLATRNDATYVTYRISDEASPHFEPMALTIHADTVRADSVYVTYKVPDWYPPRELPSSAEARASSAVTVP